MLIGMNTMALDVMAYTEKEQFKSWMQTCKRPTQWTEAPRAPLTNPPIGECNKNARRT